MAKNDFMAESAENYEQKCLCVLVLDVSGSMRGEPIKELNQGLIDFYNEVKDDETSSQRLEVCIMTFNDTVKTVQEPALVDNFTMPTLSACGTTAMCDAVKEAIDVVDARKKWYKKTEQKYYRPWIILMTDGEPDEGQDVYGLAAQIKADIEAKSYVFMSVGIEGANMQTLRTIQGENTSIPGLKNFECPAKLKGLKFKQFFQWLSASMGTVINHGDDEKENTNVREGEDIDWGDYVIYNI